MLRNAIQQVRGFATKDPRKIHYNKFNAEMKKTREGFRTEHDKYMEQRINKLATHLMQASERSTVPAEKHESRYLLEKAKMARKRMRLIRREKRQRKEIAAKVRLIFIKNDEK